MHALRSHFGRRPLLVLLPANRRNSIKIRVRISIIGSDARLLNKERLVGNRLQSRDNSPTVNCFAFQLKAVDFFLHPEPMGYHKIIFYLAISYRCLSPYRRSLDFLCGMQDT